MMQPVELTDAVHRELSPVTVHAAGWCLLAWIATASIAIWFSESTNVDIPGWLFAALMGWPLVALGIAMVMS
jgi:hypothetical protein